MFDLPQSTTVIKQYGFPKIIYILPQIRDIFSHICEFPINFSPKLGKFALNLSPEFCKFIPDFDFEFIQLISGLEKPLAYHCRKII